MHFEADSFIIYGIFCKRITLKSCSRNYKHGA